MATLIATGAIKPKTAVTLAAILNLVGAFLSTEVAKTVSGGIIREGSDGVQITPDIIFAGLMGAILWNMITWLKGLPSSSSHALFGGLIGTAIAGIGFNCVNLETLPARVCLDFPARSGNRQQADAQTRRVPHRPDLHVRPRGAGPQNQRCTEDHGHRHTGADFSRHPVPGCGPAVLGHSGMCPGHPRDSQP